MRNMWTAVAGAALMLAATPAGAGSPSGPPQQVAFGDVALSKTYETREGDIVVVVQEQDRMFRQVLGPKGPKGGRAILTGGGLAGALPLEDGRLMVAYGRPGRVVGRTIDKNGSAGEEFDLQAGIEPAGGYLMPIAGRGLGVTLRSKGAKTSRYGFVRFISPSGKIGPVKAEITRRGGEIEEVTEYREGFIVRYVTPGQKFPKIVRAQIFGAGAKKVGPEKILEPEPGSYAAFFTRVLGLADGSVVVLRRTYTGSNAEISAEAFNGKWGLTHERRVIARIPSTQTFLAEALPAGGFALALQSEGGSGIEISRFDASLTQVGEPTRIEADTLLGNVAMVGRERGDLFVTYLTFPFGGDGPKALYGQFIDP